MSQECQIPPSRRPHRGVQGTREISTPWAHQGLPALDRTSPRPTEGLSGLLSTHPTLEERLTALGEAPPPAPADSPRLAVSPRPALSSEGGDSLRDSRFWSAEAYHTRP